MPTISRKSARHRRSAFRAGSGQLLKAENTELRDRYLRLAAEMDNLRRRTERDVKDAKSYSVAGFARDMLAVSDNLRRALDAVPPEAHATADVGLKTLIEGVEIDGAFHAVGA